MKHENDLQDLLARELHSVPAPEFLWGRVHADINRPSLTPTLIPNLNMARIARVEPIWMLAAAAILVVLIIPGNWLSHITAGGPAADISLDLQSYISHVQNAAPSTSAPAIFNAPPNFETISSANAPRTLAGYTVATERGTAVHGEAVKQIVLISPSDVVSLFIASSKVRMDAGSNRWVAETLSGLNCKRLVCPKIRSLQFSCAKETCVIICKACSENAMESLMTQAAARSYEFR